ncbi:MAG TPA: helix-turn-helix domain-containing protein [Solirubrobacteraceae bacterium]|nr:helix-turn-helix domain-containing protein [Solirubrobacteraceae bacterium]
MTAAPDPAHSQASAAAAEPQPTDAGASGGELPARTRVPAAERREELIAAAVHEFAHGGLHGTPVERIARRVGVAQPYVFTLFGNKRELFLAALERSFERIAATFEHAAADFREGRAPADCEDALDAMGKAYVELLSSDRDYLMLQHQSYAACDDELVRARMRRRYAELVGLAQRLSGAEDERIDDFFRHGMALNVAAALGVEDLSSGCAWVKSELAAG